MNNPIEPGVAAPLSDAEKLIFEVQRRTAAAQNEQEQEPLVPLLTFNLSEEWYSLPLEKVKVVTRVLDVTPVPGTSRYVLGVINHKSAIYPLIDIHELLNLEARMPTRSSRFVILQHRQYLFAILVDAMAEVREVRQSELESSGRGGKEISNYVNRELLMDGRLLGILNLDTIINTVADGDTEDAPNPGIAMPT
jgi:purine-binding chemotaxis protein CheW